MEIEVEKAKSWFVLSQVLILLAGFLFASAGIAYTSAFNSFDKAVVLSLDNIDRIVELRKLGLENNLTNSTQEEIKNLTDEFTNLNKGLIQSYGDLTKENVELSKSFILFGFICSLLSMTAWGIGKYKINRINLYGKM